MEKLIPFWYAAVIGGPLTLSAALVGCTLYLTNHDVSFDFNKNTEAAIEEQQLEARHVCNELLKEQQSVIQEFNERGVSIPSVTMSMDECLVRITIGELAGPRR